MQIKRGVVIQGLQPEIILALMVIKPILEDRFNQELVITELTGGKHSKTSRHYLGYGLDIRTWQLTADGTGEECVEALQEALGEDFIVILESDHIHIGFRGTATQRA